MNYMTKRLLLCCCVLPLYANACTEVNEHGAGKKAAVTSETRVAEVKAQEKTDAGNVAGNKAQPSKLEQFLALPPASDAAKKRMKKK